MSLDDIVIYFVYSNQFYHFDRIWEKRGGFVNYKLKNDIVVQIRGVKIEDASAVLDYMTVINCETKNLTREPDEFNMTLEQEEEFLRKCIDSEDNYIYTVWHNEKLISVTGIHGSSLRRLKHRVNLGISILKEYHNQGLGTTLMRLLIQKAKELGKTKIELEVRKDNPNAVKIYRRTGFEIEGIRKNGFKVDGEYIDLILMGREL